MKDKDKTKEQLLDELIKLRQHITKLKAYETERKQAEEELKAVNQQLEASTLQLRENEEKLRVAIVGLDCNVFTQDKELRFTWAFNPAPGFDEELLLGKTDADFLPPTEASFVTEIKKRVLETGVSERSEFQLTVRGKDHVFEVIVEPLRNVSGDMIGIIGVSRDIT